MHRRLLTPVVAVEQGDRRLAELGEELRGIRAPRQHWLLRQATLQVQAHLANGEELPHELIEVGDDARLGHGFELMPRPDEGDVFLFGLLERNDDGAWAYRAWWAHTPEEDEVFVDLLTMARNAIQVGAESYSLKVIERLTDYQRSHVIDRGAGAVVSYERYMADR
jgi:hypothetical protein